MRKPIKYTIDTSLHARRDRDNWRVWRGDWFGDQFEILISEDFDFLTAQLLRFGIDIAVHGDDD